MSANSHIEWTEATWNPVTGCSKVSPGCKNCYAERMANRLQAMGSINYVNGFAVTLQPHMLELPLLWRKPYRIFVNSMSDLFHEDVPLDFILEVFSIMRHASWHEFQILTKRAERLSQLSDLLQWPDNVWMGVSVESDQYVPRVDLLRKTNAAVKFLSLEPLLGPLPSLELNGIDWVIVGGESGPRARPMLQEWVSEILTKCRTANVPFFFKQWGGVRKKRNGRTFLGRTWDEMPAAATVIA
jgi:protein gp37